MHLEDFTLPTWGESHKDAEPDLIGSARCLAPPDSAPVQIIAVGATSGRVRLARVLDRLERSYQSEIDPGLSRELAGACWNAGLSRLWLIGEGHFRTINAFLVQLRELHDEDRLAPEVSVFHLANGHYGEVWWKPYPLYSEAPRHERRYTVYEDTTRRLMAMCLHAEAATAAAARRRIGGLGTGGDFAYTAAQTLRDADLRLHTVPPEPDPRRLLEQALAHPKRLPADTDAHRIATALGSSSDFTAEVFTRIARENGPEREQVDLWCWLARCSTGHARAVAASVAAFAAWYCGSGFARIAAQAALEADDECHYARLVDRLTSTGISPAALAGSGWPVPTDLARLQALFTESSQHIPVNDDTVAESDSPYLP